jgi:predicted transposase YdaD
MARMSGWAKLLKRAEKDGLLAEYEQEWEQKGMQEGRQEERLKILELLEKGYSLEDVKRTLQLA